MDGWKVEESKEVKYCQHYHFMACDFHNWLHCMGISTEAGVLMKSFLAGSSQLPQWMMYPLSHQRQKVTIFTKIVPSFLTQIEVMWMCLCTPPVPKPTTEKVAPFLQLATSLQWQTTLAQQEDTRKPRGFFCLSRMGIYIPPWLAPAE